MGQSPDGNSVGVNIKGVEFHQGKTLFTDMLLSESSMKTDEPTKIVNKGDIVLAVRAPVGIVNITPREICIGRGLCAIQKFDNMSSEFVFYFMKTLETYFYERATGTTFIAISAEIVKNAFFPLPPLSEQQRILNKVSELMALCEEAKTARTQPIPPMQPNIIPFPQKAIQGDDDLEIGIAARGDATQPFSEELQKDIDDWDYEDE
jgi:type I restriction enzyme S subunit